MPPKGKKIKLRKKISNEKQEVRLPSEKEILLQTKLDTKVQELTELKMRVHTAQEEQNWHVEEAHTHRIEKGEYNKFMSKKTNLRQTQMVTLTDFHRQEIEDIHRDKEKMIKEYQQKKEEARLQLIRKSQLLVEAKHDLEAMDGYKIIREQLSGQIKYLEQEIKRLRAEQVHEMSRVKTTFEHEMQQQRTFGDAKLEAIQQRASQETEQYLYDRTLSIQNENTHLRKAIKNLMKRIEKLNQSKQHLQDEQLDLIRHLKLVNDLKTIRLDKTSFNIIMKSSKSLL